jgi:hypothetical protein
LVPVAPPAACTRRAVRTSLTTALAKAPHRPGKPRSPRSPWYRPAPCRCAATSAQQPSPTVLHSAPPPPPGPHRLVSFISVVGCGTCPSIGIRQNRRQVIESLTSAYKLSNPSL